MKIKIQINFIFDWMVRLKTSIYQNDQKQSKEWGWKLT
jgi:hypothetical protein